MAERSTKVHNVARTESPEKARGGPTSTYVESRLLQSAKTHTKIVGFSTALTTTILLYGYDIVIVGTVSAMPAFQRDYGQKHGQTYVLPSLWLALWNVASPLGTMVGALLGGWYQDRFGRRSSWAMGSAISAVAVAICFVSNLPEGITSRQGTFFAGKLIQGVAIGILLCTTQTYLSENLPPGLRAPGMALFPIFTLLGQLIGAIVVFISLDRSGTSSYLICFASQWPFSVAAFAVAILIPESPPYLIRKNKTAAALRSIKRLNNASFDAQQTVDHLHASVMLEREQAQTQEVNYSVCFKGTNRRRTLIVAFANTIPQLFGLTLLANASYFLQVVGMAASQSIILLVVGIVLGLMANFLSIWILSVSGRRRLILSSLGISSILWLAMGIAGCFSATAVVWYTAVTMMLIIVVCGVGAWPASFAVSGETSSLHLRAKAQGIGWLVGGLTTGIFGIVLPYIYNPDSGDLKAKTGFFYAACCALGFIASHTIIPEMKGRDTAQIDAMFELELPSRAFKSWEMDDRGALGQAESFAVYNDSF